MINDELIRAAYYSLLNGAVSYDGNPVPVADGFRVADDWVNNHIIIGDVSGSQQNTQAVFIDEVRVTLHIVTYQYNGWARTMAAEIEDLVMEILIPTVQTSPLTALGLQFNNVTRESYDYVEEESDNGNIVRKVSIITQQVVQQ